MIACRPSPSMPLGHTRECFCEVLDGRMGYYLPRISKLFLDFVFLEQALFLTIMLLRYNSYPRPVIHFKYAVQWVLVNSQICTTITKSDLKTFSSLPPKETPDPLVLTPQAPLPLAPDNHELSVSVSPDCPLLGVSWI